MKERLTGAIILVALLVLLVPELLTGPESATKPPGSEGAPLRSYTIDLADDATARPPPVTAPASQASDEPVARAKPEVDQGTSSAEGAGADAAGKRAEVPPDEAAAASAPEPSRGSGADPSAAGPAARPEPGAAASAEEPERPRSAFGPNAVSRAPTQGTREPASGASASKGWAVQLGVFASRDNAERLAKQVKAKGYAVVVNETSGNGKRLYRVRVGPEPTRDAAVALEAKLRAAGHGGSVVAP